MDFIANQILLPLGGMFKEWVDRERQLYFVLLTPPRGGDAAGSDGPVSKA